MTLSQTVRVVVAVAAFALTACSNPVAVYRGSTTQTTSEGGQSVTKTITGDTVNVFASAEANTLVFESGGLAYTATKNGDSFTFVGGQTQTVTETNGTSNTSLTSGTGTTSGNSLTLNLTLTYSQTGGGQTRNGTVMLQFTGQKI
jgi:hypothetical protein